MNCYIFFDMDDTLFQWTVTWQEAFVQIAAEAGVSATWDQAHEKLGEALNAYYHDTIVLHCAAGAPDLHEFWLDYDGRILSAMGVTGEVRHYAQRITDLLTAPGAFRLYPEVPEVLQTLHARGAKLGIITSRPLAGPDLERLGVMHYFDPILDAFTTRSTKGKPDMFLLAAAAAAQAGVPAWHVGDNYADDILGAQAAGLTPILIDRNDVHNGVGCARVTDLREIFTHIE